MAVIPLRNPMEGVAAAAGQLVSVHENTWFVGAMVLEVKKLGIPAKRRHACASLFASVTPCPPTMTLPANKFPGLALAVVPTGTTAGELAMRALAKGSDTGTSNHPVVVLVTTPVAEICVCVPKATIPLLGVGEPPAAAAGTCPPAMVN
jgi:hypothetical protein